MGVDIHMSIIKGKKYIKENIFDGRNSEWFSNLQGEGWEDEYDYLPARRGIPDEVPDKIQKDYDQAREFGYVDYYGFYYMSAKDYCDWFNKYRPDLKAGWVSTYDKWRIEKKGYIPEDPQRYLTAEDRIDDMHFIEYQDTYDCSAWLYNYLINNKIDPDATIVYYFDR